MVASQRDPDNTRQLPGSPQEVPTKFMGNPWGVEPIESKNFWTQTRLFKNFIPGLGPVYNLLYSDPDPDPIRIRLLKFFGSKHNDKSVQRVQSRRVLLFFIYFLNKFDFFFFIKRTKLLKKGVSVGVQEKRQYSLKPHTHSHPHPHPQLESSYRNKL